MGLGTGTSPAVVLREFKVSDARQPDDVIMVAEGKDGTVLAVTSEEVCFAGGGFYHKGPLASVSSVQCWYHVPAHLLTIGVLFFVAAVVLYFSLPEDYVPLAGLAAFAGLIALGGFIFGKRLELLFRMDGGEAFGMRFKPAVVSGQRIDISRARDAVDAVVRAAVAVRLNRGMRASSVSDRVTTTPVQGPEGKPTG